jgi:hypothetical protein
MATAMSPYEQDQVRSTRSVFRFVARVVWGVAAVAIAFLAFVGYMNFSLAESAPQQAAAVAWACFQVIVPYILARAVSEMLTI